MKNIKVKLSVFNRYLISFRDSIISYDVVKRKKFWGFTNNKLYLFLRLLFKNTQVMFNVTRIMKEPLGFFGSKPKKYDLYETNISPFLRFIHINKLLPAGWVKLNPGKYYLRQLKIRFRKTTTKYQNCTKIS